MSRKADGIKKVLIVRFSSIGDIVLTTPVIRCLHNQRPDIEIHYLTKDAYQSIITPLKGVSRVHILQNDWKKMIQTLKAERFDLILDLHNNLRSRRLSFSLGIRSNRFRKLNFLKWLFVHFKINRLPKVHVVDRYMKTAESLGVEYDGNGLDFAIPAGTEIAGLPQKFIAIAIGAQHHTKKLPLQKLSELCGKLKVPIVLLGGSEDSGVGQTLATRFTHVQNYAGACSLAQSALIVQKSELLVSHDTGMMHIGAALKKPIYSVWGNTVPEFGMYPLEPHPSSRQFEVEELPCRPCSKIGFDSCPKGHFRCMEEQDIPALVHGVDFFLGKEK